MLRPFGLYCCHFLSHLYLRWVPCLLENLLEIQIRNLALFCRFFSFIAREFKWPQCIDINIIFTCLVNIRAQFYQFHLYLRWALQTHRLWCWLLWLLLIWQVDCVRFIQLLFRCALFILFHLFSPLTFQLSIITIIDKCWALFFEGLICCFDKLK